MNIIETEHLTKYYGKSRGILDLNLSIKAGEFFGFIGPNGAGKSTTIRLLLGLIRPSSGTGKVLGLDVQSHARQILKSTGYIPSETLFYPGTTVADILRLSAGLRQMDCRKEAAVLCERLNLNPRQKTSSLSLGNRRKVSIVCALQHRPRLCIFDEPTSGLDPLIQREFFTLLKERSQEGATIFLSSHVLSEIQHSCDRAAIIREGRIVACGEMSALASTGARRITLRGTRPALFEDTLPPELKTGIRDLQDGEYSVSFLYQGNVRDFMNWLPHIPYSDLTVTEPDLNEIFLHYYQQETSGATLSEQDNKKGGDNHHDAS